MRYRFAMPSRRRWFRSIGAGFGCFIVSVLVLFAYELIYLDRFFNAIGSEPKRISRARVESILRGWYGTRQEGAHAFGKDETTDDVNYRMAKGNPGCYTVVYAFFPGHADEITVVYNAQGRVIFAFDND